MKTEAEIQAEIRDMIMNFHCKGCDDWCCKDGANGGELLVKAVMGVILRELIERKKTWPIDR